MALLRKYQQGDVFLHPSRPGSTYKNIEGKWFISNSDTQDKYVLINDPTGSRARALNQGAYKLPIQQPKPNFNIVSPQSTTAATYIPQQRMAEIKSSPNRVELMRKNIIDSGEFTREQVDKFDEDHLINIVTRLQNEHLQKGSPGTATISQAQDYTTANKVGNYLRNPLVSLAYLGSNFAGKKVTMPRNYDALERSPGFYDPVWDRSAALQGANFLSYFNPYTGIAQGINELPYTVKSINNAVENPNIDNTFTVAKDVASNLLDFAPSAFLSKSGRMLNPAEMGTLNTLRTSNSLGLSGLSNVIGNNVAPNIFSRPTSFNNSIWPKVLPKSFNPTSVYYQPATTNLFNRATSAGLINDLNQSTGSKLSDWLSGLFFKREHSFTERAINEGVPFRKKLGNFDEHKDIFDNLLQERMNAFNTTEGKRRLQNYVNESGINYNPAKELSKAKFVNREVVKSANVLDFMLADQALDANLLPLAKKSSRLLNRYGDSMDIGFYDRPNPEKASSVPFIFLNPDLSKSDAKHVGDHEINHLLNRGNPDHLDKELNKIVLNTGKVDVNPYYNKDSYATDYYRSDSNFLGKAKNYWSNTGDGVERTPFLAEVRRSMLEDGTINNIYSPINPEMLRKHYLQYKSGKPEYGALRFYDIVKDTPNNFKIASSVLNRMLGIGAPVGASLLINQSEK